MDGLMGQNIQLKPWLIAQPLRQTETVHAHVVERVGPGATPLEPIDHNTQLLADQSTDPCALKAKSLEQGPRKPAKQASSR